MIFFSLTRTFFPTCNMHKTFVRWCFMILYYFFVSDACIPTLCKYHKDKRTNCGIVIIFYTTAKMFQSYYGLSLFSSTSVDEMVFIWLIWFDIFVFNATFSNISAISWRPVLVVEEAGVPGENHRPWASNW